MKSLIAIFLFSLWFYDCLGQNTLKWDPEAGDEKGTLEQLSWLAGTWRGMAMGGDVEEIWSEPLGDSMMGSFKLVIDGQTRFYELMTISTEGVSLVLRLKHFNADLKGWEEKDETLDFRLVKIEGNRAYFDEFTFEKVSETEIRVYVVISDEGRTEEYPFIYSRR